MRPATIRAGLGALTTLTLVTCSVDTAPLAGGVVLDLPEGAGIAYWGIFDWENAEPREHGYGFENDLGFQFRVDTLDLATASVQLRPCADEVMHEASVWSMLGSSRAYADHVVSDDPSTAIVDRAEDALETSLDPLAVGTASGGSYCQGFLLSAVLTESHANLGMNTLAISGEYLPPGADASEDANWVHFDASVALAEGMLEELEANAGQLPPDLGADAGVDADVVIIRYPLRAFRSVDPRRLEDVELAWELLGNLLHSSTVSVRAR